MITRAELRKKIPHGYSQIIAKKANTTSKAISDYWSGTTKSSPKIEAAIIEVLQELADKKKDTNEKFEILISQL